MTLRHLVNLSDPAARDLHVSGGKGANLAVLIEAGFDVPGGHVIPPTTYREWVSDADLELASIDADDPASVRAGAERIQALLAGRPLPDGLFHEIAGVIDPDVAYSVRSSSTMEDLAGAAFAGQHETYLNCRGATGIAERVRDCYVSLWAPRAVAYRTQQGFDHAQATMAVVIQRMAPCLAAGVAFSIDPVGGDLGRIVVDANFGLGESVVGGEHAVDHFEIDKATGAIVERRIAEKTARIVASADGTTTEAVDAAAAAEPALSDDQLRELAGLVTQIEDSYRFPQDVEWGLVASGGFVVLQSRPVTTIPPRWTRDESAERFPDPLTPLTWDFVSDGFHRSLAYSLALMGLPPFNGHWFEMHDGYIYGNQNAVLLYAARLPVGFASLDELRGVVPILRTRYRWALELPVTWARDLDHYLIRLGEFMVEPLEPRDDAGVWKFVRDVNAHGAEYFLPNIAISITQSMLHRLLFMTLRLVFSEADAPRMFDALRGFAETKTGAINRELFDMALAIRAEPELESAFLAGDRNLDAFPAFVQRFRRFLRDHGHRETAFDAYVPTWIDAPHAVQDILRVMLGSDLDTPPAEKERAARVRMQAAERELFSSYPKDLHYYLSELLRMTRTYTALDDLEHYQTTRLTLPLRRGLLELGRRLVGRGLADEPSDVFFAHAAALDSTVADGTPEAWQALADEMRRAKAEYRAAIERTPAWTIGETAPPTEAGADELTGIPGSAGTAEGCVYVVRGTDDFRTFPKDAVLVARTTTPTWTPLFYSASAVVTESGGPLSHGAVTAREMGIPAVMAVRDCLTRLENGMRVRVEGTAGRVHILDAGSS